MMTFPYEPSFPICGLKELCCTMQQTDCCSEPSAMSHQQSASPDNGSDSAVPRGGDSSSTDWNKASLPWAQGTLFSLICADGAQGCSAPCSAGPASWDVTATHAGLVSTKVTATETPALPVFLLQMFPVCGLIYLGYACMGCSWASCHCLEKSQLCYSGHIDTVWGGHAGVISDWPQPTRSVGKEQNADTAVGMFSCFLSWGHL